jgi:hypothetical protein
MAEGGKIKEFKPATLAPAPRRAVGPLTHCPRCHSTNLQVQGPSARCPFCGWQGKASEMVQA